MWQTTAVVHETRSKAWRYFDVLPKLCNTFPAESEKSFNLVSQVNRSAQCNRARRSLEEWLLFLILPVQSEVISLKSVRQVNLHKQNEIKSL